MSKRGQNVGSIYQRNDGRWCATVNLGWVNGKRLRKSYYGETRKEVQDKLTTALSDIQKGLPVASVKQTLSKHLAWWLSEVVKRKNRPSTYRSYLQLVRLHIEPALGNVALAKLTTQQVRTFLNERQDSGLSSRTVQYLHAVLRKSLNVAVKDQALIRNVAALADPPQVMAKEVQPLVPDEARKFLKAIEGDRLEAQFTVAVSLGLRQGEALALRWEYRRASPRRERVDGPNGSLRRTLGTRRWLRVHQHDWDAARRPKRHQEISEALEGLEDRTPPLPRSPTHRSNAVSSSGEAF